VNVPDSDTPTTELITTVKSFIVQTSGFLRNIVFVVIFQLTVANGTGLVFSLTSQDFLKIVLKSGGALTAKRQIL